MRTTPKDAEDPFVHTGPGTLAGRYLRRYWQPVWTSHELERGQVFPIRVLGEDFTLYRGESGLAQVTAFRCPHRGTQLSTGLVVGDNLECYYHGWQFARSGDCVAQPAEPKPFCHKVRLRTYPTREAAGLIFAYLGDDAPPPLPTWPELAEARGARHRMDCNYFQSAENIVDDVHVQFTHRGAVNRDSPHTGMPRMSAIETSFGLTQVLTHENTIKAVHFLMPNACHLVTGFARNLGSSVVFWYVPIDDFSHQHFAATNAPTTTAPTLTPKIPSDPRARDDWFSANTRDILSGRRRLNEFQTADYFRLQDTVMCVGQGAIADRSMDRLGTSDAGVILLRKLWRREVQLLAEGKPLTPFESPTSLRQCAEIAAETAARGTQAPVPTVS